MIKKIIPILLMVFLFGCIQEISQNDFFQKWEESKNHSAVFWWYAGEDKTYSYFIQEWPTKSNGYKIKKKFVSLLEIDPFSINEKKKVNLKYGNIKPKNDL